MKIITGKPRGDRTRDIEIEIADHDMWNVDTTLALIIAPILTRFREMTSGKTISATDTADAPRIGDPNDRYDAKRWEHVLNEIEWTFKQLAKAETVDGTYDDSRVDNGLRLFGKYYRRLWT